MRVTRVTVLAVVASSVLVGCSRAVRVESDEVRRATAAVVNSSGAALGTLNLLETGAGVSISGTLNNVPAGEHGFHVHAVGKCEGPAFTSAGGHFNPTAKKHGHKNPEGYHAGDLGNVTASGSSVQINVTTRDITLASGAPNSVLDADGSALMLHAAADDETSDPAGNAGARIACGVIR